MCVGDVGHVDIVADAGAVAGVVVGAVNGHRRPFAAAGLHDDGHQVVGLVGRQFAVQSCHVGAYRVEVAEQDGLELGVAFAEGVEDAFANLFGMGVRTGGDAHGSLFRDRQVFHVAVDGAGGGENEVRHMVAVAGLDDVEQRVDIVAVIQQRFLHRLGHALVRREMDNAVYRAFLLKHGAGGRKVEQVGLVVFDTAAGNLFDAVHGAACRTAEVVDGDDVKTAVTNQLDKGVGADVAVPASH